MAARNADKARHRLAGIALAVVVGMAALLETSPASAIDLTVGSGSGRVTRFNSTAIENRLKRQIYQNQQQQLREQDRDTVVRQPPRNTIPPTSSKCIPWSDQGRYAVVCR